MVSKGASPRYNKGEWAELFVLAHLLCEGEVTVGKYSPNESTRKLQVLGISRGSKTHNDFALEGDYVLIGDSKKTVARSEICALVRSLLPAIQVGKWVFSANEGDQLLDLLSISQLKTGGEKSDLYLNVLDPLSGATGLQGFTIKSFVGSSPTLLNAGLATNFTFQLSPGITPTDVSRLNALPIREMCRELVDLGHKFQLIQHHAVFGANLSVLDSRMIEVISHGILAAYSMRCGREAGVGQITDYLAATNPMGVANPDVFYHHKLKGLLEAVTYGMVPSKKWDGKRTAQGGLLIVEKSGELTCIPAGSSDEHREYLLQSTKFETPSRRRHKFGSIYSQDGNSYLALNLQIRYQ